MKKMNSITDVMKLTKTDVLELITLLSDDDKVKLKNKLIQMNEKNEKVNFTTIKIWTVRRLYPNLIKKSEPLYNTIMDVLE